MRLFDFLSFFDESTMVRIIDDKEELVVKTFNENPDFEVVEVNHQGEWVNVTVKKIS